MATLQELESALIKADAAGNADDAKVFADEIRRMRGMGAGQAAQQSAERSFPERLGRQVGLTARAGLSGLAALPSMLWNGPVDVINQYAGTNIPRSDIGPAMNAVGLPQPENATERVAQDVASAMAGTGGISQLGQGMAKAATPVVQGVGSLLSSAPAAQVASAIGGAGAGGTARELGFGPGVQLGASVLGSMAAGMPVNAYTNRQTMQRERELVPTVEQLKKRASELFEHAQERGITASQEQTQSLAAQMRGLAQQEGLISPTGRISEAYPKAREALRMLDDYAQGSMDPRQMQTVRKVLSDAAGSVDKSERRIASMMLDQFDDFVSPMAPQFQQARQLYSRAMKGQQLETLSELAESRASQFSGSGGENALRTEFRKLNNDIIKGRARGWSPDQAAAIRRVAEGTAASNAARNIGRLAPTGVVSFGLGGGVPYMIGNSIGGPVLGSMASAGVMGGSFAARELAERLAKGYARDAQLIARNGGLLASPASKTGLLGGTFQGLLAGQAVTNSSPKKPDR